MWKNPVLFTKLLWTGLVLNLGVILFLIGWLRPFYGVADDGSILSLCDSTWSQGFWATMARFIQEDASWGMVRPTYFLFSQTFYCATDGLPALLYAINLLLVIGAHAALGWALYLVLPKRNWPLQAFLPAFLLLSLAVYRFHDNLFIAGMQEKLVLFAGAALLGLSYRVKFSKLSLSQLSLWLGLISLCLIVGLGTKAQFLIFIPLSLLILLAQGWESGLITRAWTSVFVVALVGISGALFIKWVSSQGGYTSQYSLSRVGQNLASRQAILLISLALLTLAGEFYFRRRENAPLPQWLRSLIPSSFLLGFLAIMSPWSIGDSYIIAPTAPMVAICILSLWQNFSWHKSGIALALLVVCSLLMTSYRGYRGFGRWHDLGAILKSDALQSLAQEKHVLLVSCMEGGDLFKIYAHRYHNLQLNVAMALPENSDKENSQIYTLADSALCPLAVGAEATVEKLTTPLFADSFTLYRVKY